MTSKGQVTIPLAVRKALGLHAGTPVDFVRVDGGYKVVPLSADVPAGLKGRFAGRVARPVTLEQMDEAIADAASARHASVKVRARTPRRA